MAGTGAGFATEGDVIANAVNARTADNTRIVMARFICGLLQTKLLKTILSFDDCFHPTKLCAVSFATAAPCRRTSSTATRAEGLLDGGGERVCH